ncbi:MAG TPA: tRNA (adenosine(37)-N6)-dimethylallyltransferase MiaA [Chitinophagaceae bacterium]|nr:tRNA (adenosine(37)-N6)-dimethylallyltransferase MiaA [Chitinophagaceae bacterium]
MEVPFQKTVIIIVGPTAVGKTPVAIRLAQYFSTEIISADSRQCYRELNIGVARPTPEELAAVPHHFIASHSIHEEVTAAVFEKYALQKLQDLFRQHHVVLMAGGTGLYIKAFCEGLDEIPDVDREIRTAIIRQYNEKGLPWLQEEIRHKDPAFFEVGEVQNPQRLMRALEVREATGKSILDFRSGKKTRRNFNIVKIGVQLPREQLHQRIAERVDRMMQEGLLEEVRSLYPYRHLPALQTVGYHELIDHLEGKISLAGAVEQIKASTRQYARRQMTWFRKDRDISWFTPGDMSAVLKFIGGGA